MGPHGGFWDSRNRKACTRMDRHVRLPANKVYKGGCEARQVWLTKLEMQCEERA